MGSEINLRGESGADRIRSLGVLKAKAVIQFFRKQMMDSNKGLYNLLCINIDTDT